MKKIITIAIMACALVSTAFAEDQAYKKVRLGFTADYTMSVMSQVNTELNRGTGVTAIGPGVSGMVNLDVVLLPVLMAGVRGGYLYCMPATAIYLAGTVKETFNASLIPAEAGVTANLEIPNMPLSVMVGAFGGYGYAMSSVKKDIIGNVSYTQPYTGGNFIGEVVGTINYKLSSSLSLNINGGYRLANITQLTQSEDVTYTLVGVPVSAGAKGDVLKDSSGKTLAFDFSGFNAGVGFSLGF